MLRNEEQRVEDGRRWIATGAGVRICERSEGLTEPVVELEAQDV